MRILSFLQRTCLHRVDEGWERGCKVQFCLVHVWSHKTRLTFSQLQIRDRSFLSLTRLEALLQMCLLLVWRRSLSLSVLMASLSTTSKCKGHEHHHYSTTKQSIQSPKISPKVSHYHQQTPKPMVIFLEPSSLALQLS